MSEEHHLATKNKNVFMSKEQLLATKMDCMSSELLNKSAKAQSHVVTNL